MALLKHVPADLQPKIVGRLNDSSIKRLLCGLPKGPSLAGESALAGPEAVTCGSQ